MGRRTGLEPAVTGITTQAFDSSGSYACDHGWTRTSTPELRMLRSIQLARPLVHTYRVVKRRGGGTRTRKAQVRSPRSAPLGAPMSRVLPS